mgnify:CR=1 FL=1
MPLDLQNLESGSISTGSPRIWVYEEGLDVITRLEKKLKLISGAKHALYVNSGTSALLLAFYAANFGISYIAT